MVICCYSLITNKWPDHELADRLSSLPGKLKEDALRKRQWIDRQLSIVGKLMLREVLDRFGFGHLSLGDLKFGSHHRPYFDEDIDFNISHSGNLVICCGTDKGKAGIDVEQTKPIDADEFTDYFTPSEWSIIRNAANPNNSFYDFWTRKEAVLKAIGTGFHTPLSSIDVANEVITYDNISYHIEKIHLHEDYLCNIAITQKQEIKAPICLEY
jgi:4'-phosphopantetheinyl transferase